MIVVDTHVWVWWASGDAALSPVHSQILAASAPDGIGVSVISCWEVAVLVARRRLLLDQPLDQWIEIALRYPGVRVLDLTVPIALHSTLLPGEFHRDPADRFLVATAMAHGCPLLSADEKILRYPHVRTIGPRESTS